MTLKHIAGLGRRKEEQGGVQKELQREGEGGQKGRQRRRRVSEIEMSG